jgi:hypothetical protein
VEQLWEGRLHACIWLDLDYPKVKARVSVVLF